MLEINNISKTYRGGVKALQNISFKLDKGVLGLVGPNGAGKSTLLRTLAGVIKPSQGTVKWKGNDTQKDPAQLRRELGYLPQDFNAYPHLTAREFLNYIGQVKGLQRAELKDRVATALETVNLNSAADRPIGGFSGGMRQRVGIAQTLLNDPQILIVDEPTVGLDPTERNRFRHLITNLSTDRVIILSTHIIADIEATATQVAFLFRGTLSPLQAPSVLLKQLENRIWDVVVDEGGVMPQGQIISTARRLDGVHVRLYANEQPLTAQPLMPTLEDVYATALWQAEGAVL